MRRLWQSQENKEGCGYIARRRRIARAGYLDCKRGEDGWHGGETTTGLVLLIKIKTAGNRAGTFPDAKSSRSLDLSYQMSGV